MNKFELEMAVKGSDENMVYSPEPWPLFPALKVSWILSFLPVGKVLCHWCEALIVATVAEWPETGPIEEQGR